MLYYHFYVYDNEIVRKPSGYDLPNFLLFTDLQKWKMLPLKENISNPETYQTSRSQNQSKLQKGIT